MRKLSHILFLVFLQLSSFAYSQGCDCDLWLNRQQGSIGPEWYHVKREKKGGVEQNGNVWGFYFSYDRLKRYGWYWGIEGNYAIGTLRGHAEESGKLSSKFTDAWAEGHFGYTFQQKECPYFSFTPYIGIGYLSEKNNFDRSSILPIHFNIYFPYASAGFLSWIQVWDDFELGLNFKAKFPYEPKCQVTNDPDNDSITQNIDPKFQYRIDLPLTYRFSCDDRMAITADPFFEYRHYGHNVNFPFDFIDTKMNFWGLIIEFVYRI